MVLRQSPELCGGFAAQLAEPPRVSLNFFLQPLMLVLAFVLVLLLLVLALVLALALGIGIGAEYESIFGKHRKPRPSL